MPRPVRTIRCCMLMLGVLSAAAIAMSPTLTKPVDQLRAQLNNPKVSAQTRPQILEELLEARGQLIDSNEAHEDAVFWRTAQAEDAILQGLRMNGLEMVVRHGLPGDLQAAQFDRLVRIAIDQTGSIEALLPDAIDAAQSDTDRLARLEALRDSRLPMLRGMAMVIGAERGLLPDDDRALQEGTRLLLTSIPTLRGEEGKQAARQLAIAKLKAGQVDESQQMLEQLQRVGGDVPMDQTAIRLALNEITAALTGWKSAAVRAQIIASTNDDPLERLLMVEQAARNWIRHADQLSSEEDADAEAERIEAERNAVEAFLLLLPENGGLTLREPRLLDLMIEERLGKLEVADLNAPHIPDAMRVAKAVPLVSSKETALRAREQLLPLVDKRGMIPRVRIRMFAMLVRAELTAGMDAEASGHAIVWSRIASNRDEAHEAAELAMVHAIEAMRQSPEDESRQKLLRQAIDNMFENFPDHPRIDLWRMQAADQAIRSGDPVDAMLIYSSIAADSKYRPDAISKQAILIVDAATQEPDRTAAIQVARERLSQLRAALAEVKPAISRAAKNARIGLDLCEARIDLLDGKAVESLQALTSANMDSIDPALASILHRARVEAAIATGRTGAVEAVVDDLPFSVDTEVVMTTLPSILAIPGSPLPNDPLMDPAQKTAAWKLAVVLEAGAEANVANRLLIAAAFHRAGRHEDALSRLTQLLEIQPDLGDALFLKAECLRQTPGADPEEIIRLYTRLSSGEPGDRPDRFWTSQLRLLQSMQADGHDADRILARLNRLQRRFPDLGGPAYISEFALLREQLSPTR